VKRTTPNEYDRSVEPKKIAKDFKFPFLLDEKFNKYIAKFMFSFKNIYTENINAKNLMIFTGPSKIGKSWLLRYNMRRFINSDKVISFNLFILYRIQL
jgi:hypothetical protein